MDFRIVWTHPALDDLAELVRYIASDDPETAIRVGDDIVDHVAVLATFPEIVPVYQPRRGKGVRQITCRPFHFEYSIG